MRERKNRCLVLAQAALLTMGLIGLTPRGGRAADPTQNLLQNLSFEKVENGQLVGWSLGDNGLSSLTEEKAHSGQRSLKIADPDEKVGSNVHSEAHEVRAGREYLVSVWSYLADGKPGLGVYVDFLDQQGNRIEEASEKTNHAAVMAAGQWCRTVFTATPPPEAKRVAVWLHTYSVAVLTCYVDDVELTEVEPGHLGPAVQWEGGTPDKTTRKVWPYSVRWNHGESNALHHPYAQPQDWSKYGAVSFWLNSEKATGSAFMLILSSENDKSDGMDYYSYRIQLDWTGWRKFVLPFRELPVSRQPVGWQKIDNVYFTASGWNNTPNPEAVAYLDGFEVIPLSEKGPRMTDEEFFSNLNLEAPGLKEAKAAVSKGDVAAAKRELAKHLRDRKAPRWAFDWRDHPFLGAKLPAPQEDKAPDQWDYYSLFISIDWQGWKRFTFKKEDFSPKAFVEGEGWKGKKPIGWNWIRYIRFSATGWGLKPDPECVLCFDDIKLIGKDRTVSISDFEREATAWEGLTRTTEQAKVGKYSGKWANQLVTGGIQCWKIPHDWTNFDTLDFWVYSQKATGSRIVLILDSDVPKAFGEADELCQRKFGYQFTGAGKAAIEMGERINWKANPTQGEARTHLWNESLNRHFHFSTLADAYWQSGDEKYARELVAQWLDWIEQNPVPLLSSGNDVEWPYGCYAWQTLTTGIRLESTWPNALYRCLGSQAMTDEAITAILKSVCEQARHLIRWPTSHNWLTEECMGVFTAGMLFPEFKEAKEWRRIALERLYKQLDDEVYPDGMEYELAAGYSNWVVSNFSKLLDLAELNSLQQEVPKDYQVKMEKMFNYLLYASMPNGAIPGLNDSGNSDVKGLLSKGYQLFPHRDDFLYAATARERGKAPEQISYAFPYTGHYVMRSGWDANACYLLFDAGPYGSAHQHEDKLHFVLWACGKQHVLDPGNYSYDASRWRHYVLTTPGHNTVMVDGQGQRRAAKRETHFWPRPWTAPVPPENNTRWVSTPEADYAVGVYADGYGPKNDVNVAHTRRILFVKPDYFVVADTLTPADEAEHRYEALFHLDTENAALDEQIKAVRTSNAEASNLTLLPLADPTLSVEIVKGKEEEPVQGWANDPWRAIPTVIYRKSGKGTVRLLTVLCPVAKGLQAPVVRVEKVEGDFPGIAARIAFADGQSHTVVLSEKPGQTVRAGDVETKAEVTVAKREADGKAGQTVRLGQP